MALASSGNLSLSQSVVSLLSEGFENPDTGETRNADERADHVPGGAARRPRHPHGSRHRGERAEAADVKFDVAFLFGGQIKGERLRLFMIYSAGNFIECTTDTPYLQIGEHKYGKPILDRAITYDTDLYDALKIGADLDGFRPCAPISSVGLPIDLRGGAARRLRRRTELPDRAGRALFPRPARALVGGAAGRPHRHSPPALRAAR